jgi:hypothetical protein
MNSTNTAPQKSSTTYTPFAFTGFTSTKHLNKQFKLSDGSIDKTSNAVMTEGNAQTLTVNDGFTGLNTLLNNLTPYQAISTGVFDVTNANIVTKEKYSTLAKENRDDYRARTKEHITQPSTGLVLFDYDYNDNCPFSAFTNTEELIGNLAKLAPSFNDAACLIRPSSSNGIKIAGTDIAQKSTSQHCFFLYDGDLEVFQETLELLSWLNGFGWWDISKAGSLLPRAIVDLSVFSPERLIFEAPPTLGEGVEREITEPFIRDSSELLTLPDITPEQRSQALKLKSNGKTARQAEADIVRDEYIENKANVLSNKQEITYEKAVRVIKKSVNGNLELDFPLTLPSGNEGFVADLIENWECYNNKSMPDPHEGVEYGRTTAKYYYNDGKPVIHSQAHGGCTYRLSVSDKGEEFKTNERLDGLLKDIKGLMCRSLGVSLKELPSILEEIDYKPYAIARIIEMSFWHSGSSKMYTLNKWGELINFSKTECKKYLFKAVPPIFSYEEVYEMLVAHLTNTTSKKEAAISEEAAKLTKSLMSGIKGLIEMHIIYNSQRNNIGMKVDMFADKNSLVLKEDIAEITYTHTPFITGIFNTEIVADYKEQFPELDDVLNMLVAARFAQDRKLAYLWLNAVSDWGKGFFFGGVLKDLGLIVEMSTKEVEAIFEAKPVGKSMKEFKRCFAIFFDEFKTVKGEIKQLQNSITLNVKYEPSITVDIFTKLFASAESVDSLMTEYGIEDQFANRFSLILGKNRLPERPLYKSNSVEYYNNIKKYAADFLNNEVLKMVTLGFDEATIQAGNKLKSFHTKYAIDKHIERFSNSLPDLADEIRAWINDCKNNVFEQPNWSNDIQIIKECLLRNNESYYLKSPSRVVGYYINNKMDHSSKGAIGLKKKEIVRLLSADGLGTKARLINHANVKCITINLKNTSDEFDHIDDADS